MIHRRLLFRTLLVLFSGIGVSMATVLQAEDTKHPARELVTAARVLVIAHRGDSGAAPENTIPAFQGALAAKADLVELDYYHSADRIPVVFHDDTLDRTTNAARTLGKGRKITSLTLAELRELDAGIWFDARFAGTRIPSLEESIEAIQAGSVTLVERKGGDAATCVELLTRMGLTRALVVQAFDWEYLTEVHRLAPETVLAALGSKKLTSERFTALERTGARIVAWKGADLDAAAIRAAHERGLKVWAYTINQQAEAERLLAAGIDGIITDQPAAMRRWIEAAALPAR